MWGARSGRINGFAVKTIDPLTLERTEPLASMYALSPFVWAHESRFCVLLRGVNRSSIASEKVARVYYGTGGDGLHFTMRSEPAIRPGPEAADRDGCEDPTLAVLDDCWFVYYTGWNQQQLRGELLLASGPDADHLRKRGVALASTRSIRNPKEATIVRAADGTWRLLFEYAAGGSSRVGVAMSRSVDGPWEVRTLRFEPRPGTWDAWHLSTGPVWSADPDRPVMFYNGATADARWRIGWVAFDREYTKVVDRSDEPLIVPPSPQGEDTDIAFAASHVEVGDDIWLYYSVADKDMYRAILRPT